MRTITSRVYWRRLNESRLRESLRSIAGLRSARGYGPEAANFMVAFNGVEIPEEAVAEFCRQHGIRRLSLFGSILQDDFGPDSDIDVLVEFEPGTRVGLRFFTMERELSQLFGRKVDLNTPGFLSKYFRDEVLAEAVVQYDAA